MNGQSYSDYLIVYNGQDEHKGYNFVQDKCGHHAEAEPNEQWSFDFKVITAKDRVLGVSVPDVNYIEVL